MHHTVYINHMLLFTTPARFGVYWHHFREATPNCKFFEKHKMIINTCYNHQVLIIILCVAKNLQFAKVVSVDTETRW